MRVKEAIRGALEEAIQRLAPEANVEITLERPRHKAHGDYACNAAMQLARVLKRNPREIAAAILEAVAWPEGVARAEVAGPGFINIFLEPGAENRVLARILTDPSWSRPDLGHGARVLVEYVSANPTGPMHVGHGRGAVVGDAIANLLAHTGWQVEREYYINDAGNQVRTLARTVWLRMRELMGEEITLPEDAYPAPYVIEIARAALEKKPFADWAAMDEAEREDELGRFAVDWNMREIRACLDALGIRFDRFVSERALHEEGAVARAIEALQAKGAVYRGVLPPPKGKPVDDYEPREQLLFRATAYGDETDRPLVKSDGSYTYFAADIAYHADKLRRGYARLINVWGADHGGYVKRLQAAVEALSGRKGCPEVVLVQMVRITREGKPVRLSKRAGNIVALDELVREVGKDAVRFNMLTRR
ncbi:MAG: arginine--tRNA ligase, partial [Zetaproteobacteria bacterium]